MAILYNQQSHALFLLIIVNNYIKTLSKNVNSDWIKH